MVLVGVATQILLETGTRRVKLADFGLAKSQTQTATQGVGTPAYMVPACANLLGSFFFPGPLDLTPPARRLSFVAQAPEMFEDQAGVSVKGELAVDIYALGIIAWELWHRKAPLSGMPVHKVVLHVTAGKRPPIAPGAMPPPLQRLLEACWAQSPLNRPRASAVVRCFGDLFAPSSASFQAMQESMVRRAVARPGALATNRFSDMETLDEDAHFSEAPLAGLHLPAPPVASSSPRAPLSAASAHAGAAGTVSRGRSPRRGHGDAGDFPAARAATVKGLGRLAGPPLPSLREFLAEVNLSHHLEALEAFGFTDVEMLSDRELLDDDTLLKVVGMSKHDVKLLRGRIEAKGTGPTLMSRRAADIALQRPTGLKKLDLKA